MAYAQIRLIDGPAKDMPLGLVADDCSSLNIFQSGHIFRYRRLPEPDAEGRALFAHQEG